MQTNLDRVVFTSGSPENRTAPHSGFVFCPIHGSAPLILRSEQEAIYQWAFTSAQAQVAAAQQKRRWHSLINPSLN